MKIDHNLVEEILGLEYRMQTEWLKVRHQRIEA